MCHQVHIFFESQKFSYKIEVSAKTLEDVICHSLDLSGIHLTLFTAAHRVICFGSVVKLLITHW